MGLNQEQTSMTIKKRRVDIILQGHGQGHIQGHVQGHILGLLQGHLSMGPNQEKIIVTVKQGKLSITLQGQGHGQDQVQDIPRSHQRKVKRKNHTDGRTDIQDHHQDLFQGQGQLVQGHQGHIPDPHIKEELVKIRQRVDLIGIDIIRLQPHEAPGLHVGQGQGQGELKNLEPRNHEELLVQVRVLVRDLLQGQELIGKISQGHTSRRNRENMLLRHHQNPVLQAIDILVVVVIHVNILKV